MNDEIPKDYSSFPEAITRLFERSKTEADIDALMQQYKDAMVKLWYEQDGNNYSEVFDIFPENPEISIGDIQASTSLDWNQLPFSERSISIDGSLFTLKENIDRDWTKLIQNWKFFEIPENLKRVKSTRLHIFQRLKNRTPVLNLNNDIHDSPEILDRALRTKLITVKALSYGQSHNSLGENQFLQRYWEFLFWYLLYHNKSLQTTSQS